MTDLITFDVAYVLETVGTQYGVNLVTNGIDDQCYGCVFATDTSLAQFVTQHAPLYNYLPYDDVDGDGNPVTFLKRISIGDDLAIDLEIDESECIQQSANQPVIKRTRVDPLGLPRTVAVQYGDPARDYATNEQPFTWHPASLQRGKLTVASNFIISAEQARAQAAGIVCRLWAQNPTLTFEHPNPDIQTGDVLSLTSRVGTYTLLVQTSALTRNRTSLITGTALLTEAPTISVPGGTAAAFDLVDSQSTDDTSWLLTVM